MYWNTHDMSGWGWFAMSLSSIVFWALLVAIAVLLFRTVNRGHTGTNPPPPEVTPERLLAERFARGEIDEDEYWRRMAVLRADSSGRTEHSPRL
ncbi:SHOCT domain-containing protein [Streptomyces sp. NBC_01615]|uniref:SHOCT domain-containing protein n=1 Tax=Streptomyces sp. NBC_01615 TaxID=2975898 RepID=UPI00386415AA